MGRTPKSASSCLVSVKYRPHSPNCNQWFPTRRVVDQLNLRGHFVRSGLFEWIRDY